MLIVACRLMTSGVNGVSLLGSSVFKFCSKATTVTNTQRETSKYEPALYVTAYPRQLSIADLFAQSAFLAHFVSMHCRDQYITWTWRSASDSTQNFLSLPRVDLVYCLGV